MLYASDFHLHSPYSRAVSPRMTLGNMAKFAVEKGVDLLSTGDFTHPVWIEEIEEQLAEKAEGIYCLQKGLKEEKEVGFILGAEISSIYKSGDKVRRIHNLVFTSNLKSAKKITEKLKQKNCNLNADGRPIIGLSSRDLFELILSCDENAFLIPAHIWTPHFGVYGAASGFASLEEAFGDLATYIYAVETGLSSDPQMNWAISELRNRSIVSFSDAHSPEKIARELTFLKLQEKTFASIRKALQKTMNQANYVSSTLEFFPQEGKYHYAGHRFCKVSYSPQEVMTKGNICPICRKKLTDGVFSRIQELSRQKMPVEAKKTLTKEGVVSWEDPRGIHAPYIRMVPLKEIIAEAIGLGVSSKKVQQIYQYSLKNFGKELEILLKITPRVLSGSMDERIVQAIIDVRAGDVSIKPGFDGVYGEIHLRQQVKSKLIKSQLPLEI